MKPEENLFQKIPQEQRKKRIRKVKVDKEHSPQKYWHKANEKSDKIYPLEYKTLAETTASVKQMQDKIEEIVTIGGGEV